MSLPAYYKRGDILRHYSSYFTSGGTFWELLSKIDGFNPGMIIARIRWNLHFNGFSGQQLYSIIHNIRDFIVGVKNKFVAGKASAQEIQAALGRLANNRDGLYFPPKTIKVQTMPAAAQNSARPASGGEEEWVSLVQQSLPTEQWGTEFSTIATDPETKKRFVHYDPNGQAQYSQGVSVDHPNAKVNFHYGAEEVSPQLILAALKAQLSRAIAARTPFSITFGGASEAFVENFLGALQRLFLASASACQNYITGLKIDGEDVNIAQSVFRRDLAQYWREIKSAQAQQAIQPAQAHARAA
jgi:hypothetical protein